MKSKAFIDDPWTDGTYTQDIELHAENNMLLMELGKHIFRLRIEDILAALAVVDDDKK